MNRLALVLCVMATVSCAGPETSVRPEARPQATQMDRSVQEEDKQGGFFQSLRPVFRSSKQRELVAGSVCGDPSIQGEVIGRVPGAIAGCGIENAMSIASVSGVRLSPKAMMDCSTAQALKQWVDTSAKPALSRKGGGLREIQVAAHYACRRRNNAKTGKISEHGTGRAIDISGFRMADGSQITVLEHWSSRSSGKALQRMHAGACGPFGTVLGPRANRFHADHFHFDTARYRSGTYCR
tara:strand:- start:1121 stop:1837 length:717 start_codon:yes stop_codon:yes gene_type:complete